MSCFYEIAGKVVFYYWRVEKPFYVNKNLKRSTCVSTNLRLSLLGPSTVMCVGMLVNDACVWEGCFALEKVNNLQRNFQFQHTLSLVDAMISAQNSKYMAMHPGRVC